MISLLTNRTNVSRDCTQKRGQFGGPPQQGGQFPPPPGGVDQGRAQQFDSEYASLMAELGETSSSAPLAGGDNAAPWMAPSVPLDENGEKIPPWRIAANWYVLSSRFLLRYHLLTGTTIVQIGFHLNRLFSRTTTGVLRHRCREVSVKVNRIIVATSQDILISLRRTPRALITNNKSLSNSSSIRIMEWEDTVNERRLVANKSCRAGRRASEFLFFFWSTFN